LGDNNSNGNLCKGKESSNDNNPKIVIKKKKIRKKYVFKNDVNNTSITGSTIFSLLFGNLKPPNKATNIKLVLDNSLLSSCSS
jgi:hypothetical protein